MRFLRTYISIVACLLVFHTNSHADVYQSDDGESGLSFAIAPGVGVLSWGNSFETDPNCTTVTGISIGFGDDTIARLVEWRIFGDSDEDPRTGLVLLAQGTHVVENEFRTANVFDEISTSGVDVSEFDYFFVTATMTGPSSLFPALADLVEEDLRNSWLVSADSNPANWASGGLLTNPLPDFIDSGDDWLIRAQGEAGGLLGDVNCDGVVDLLDIGPFVDLIVTGDFSAKADFNSDGMIDLLDVGPFVDSITGS